MLVSFKHLFATFKGDDGLSQPNLKLWDTNQVLKLRKNSCPVFAIHDFNYINVSTKKTDLLYQYWFTKWCTHPLKVTNYFKIPFIAWTVSFLKTETTMDGWKIANPSMIPQMKLYTTPYCELQELMSGRQSKNGIQQWAIHRSFPLWSPHSIQEKHFEQNKTQQVTVHVVFHMDKQPKLSNINFSTC